MKNFKVKRNLIVPLYRENGESAGYVELTKDMIVYAEIDNGALTQNFYYAGETGGFSFSLENDQILAYLAEIGE